MDESERTVHAAAARGEGAAQRVCKQLVSHEVRYRFWLNRHEQPMTHVAEAKYRDEQILVLRKAAVEQVHKTALVRYLNDYNITGEERRLTLAEFHSVVDPVQATITEHHNYLLSASTGYCAEALLEMVADKHGLDMIRKYREKYGQFFSLYCGHARAMRRGKQYLLTNMIPELRSEAASVRNNILAGHALPPTAISNRHLKRAS